MTSRSLLTFARALGGLHGWRRNLVAYLLGVCATLTLAPFYLFGLLLVSFSGLLWLLDAAPSRRRMFLDGWWWGWGFYMSGLYWMCIALLTDPAKFGWLIPPTLLGLNGVIALYPAVACWLMSWLRVRGLSKILVFTIVWTLVEYARGHLFTGFPWNLPGYAFGFSNAALQMASLVGVYGLSWFALLLATTPVALGAKKAGKIYAASLWALFLFGLFWGVGRLHQANSIPQAQRYVPGVTLRLVQADIAQPDKWDPQLQLQGVREHAALTRLPGLEKVTHVIWPETAVPYTIGKDEPITRSLGGIIPPGAILITGSLRSEGDKENWRIWNSLSALDHDGNIVGSYDKAHLVPFGEFLPFRYVFPKEWLTPVGDTDFSAGTQGKLMELPGLPPMLPLICYEAIFPELVVDGPKRPQWLLSVTNDAWFGMSTGPHQHFEMARMRAVEQGVPLVRSGNTGISAVVDSWGQVISFMPLGYKGIIDSSLPVAQAENTTCNKINKIFIPFLIIFALILIFRKKSGVIINKIACKLCAAGK